jgi:hypothetical protein
VSADWPAAAYFRPSATGDQVIARDPLTGIQLGCGSNLFAVAGDGDDVGGVARQLADLRRQAGVSDHDVEMSGEWLGHGWSPSLEYYLDSRRVRFADTTDDDGATRLSVLREYLREGGPPPTFEPEGRRVPLPPPGPSANTLRLSQFLLDRRSVRVFSGRPVPAGAISDFLWAGLTEVRRCRAAQDPGQPLSLLRSYGSAWVFVLVVYDVTGIQPGAYHYDPLSHELIQVRTGDLRDAMVRIYRGMQAPRTACLTLGLIADTEAYQWRYRHSHALRRLYVESGAIAQHLLAAGRASRLEGFVTPAQHDSAFLDVAGCRDSPLIPVHTLTLGTRQPAGGPEDAR